MSSVGYRTSQDDAVATETRNLLRDTKLGQTGVIEVLERIQWQLANINEDDNIKPGEKRYE